MALNFGANIRLRSNESFFKSKNIYQIKCNTQIGNFKIFFEQRVVWCFVAKVSFKYEKDRRFGQNFEKASYRERIERRDSKIRG